MVLTAEAKIRFIYFFLWRNSGNSRVSLLEMFSKSSAIPKSKIISQRTSFSLQSSLFFFFPHHITSRFLSRVDFQPPPRDSSQHFDDLFSTVSCQNFICFFLLTRTFANRLSSSDGFGIGWRFLLRMLGCRM